VAFYVQDWWDYVVSFVGVQLEGNATKKLSIHLHCLPMHVSSSVESLLSKKIQYAKSFTIEWNITWKWVYKSDTFL
jgi:hypothetical protein